MIYLIRKFMLLYALLITVNISGSVNSSID